ncbi:MAG: stage 0 sporulation family protein, partial [Vagococcus sp.]
RNAYTIAKEKISQHNLEMKLVDAEYTFDRSKIIFSFTADGRIDFRELVKDLASIFKTRIELRQIGVRDEAKLLGGIGPCGRPLCCSTFLGDFAAVSIKMAKEQGLSLNPTKISGVCGRLMCCLNYENEEYERIRKTMPDFGKTVPTPDGPGRVIGINVLSEVVKIKLQTRETPVEYDLDELLEAKELTKKED